MSRPASGSLDMIPLAGGVRAFQLRFTVAGRRERVILHEQSGCRCGCGGGWDERAARNELGNLLARVRVGVWQPPEPLPTFAMPAADVQSPTFGEYARWWLQAKIDGALGTRGGLRARTAEDYRWRLGHLLPFFGPHPLDRIDGELCLAFKARILRDANELRAALAAGADLRGENNQPLRPLGLRSIRHILDTLAAILDDAIEGWPPRAQPRALEAHAPLRAETAPHVPRGRRAGRPARRRSRPGRAPPTAAGRRPRPDHPSRRPPPRTGDHAVGDRQTTRRREIHRQLAPAPHRRRARPPLRRPPRRLRDPRPRGRARRRAVRAAHRPHAPPRPPRRPLPHPRRQDRSRHPRGPDDARPRRGCHRAHRPPQARRPPHRPGRLPRPEHTRRRISEKRVGTILREAAAEASRHLAARGLPPLPHTTAHTLRRTYISIALRANNFDVKWVMSQVGHTDSKMTLDVYAQLEQRVDRGHGENFDRLVRTAR